MFSVHPHYLFGFTRSVQQRPPPPDPTHHQLLISWQLYSSVHLNVPDIQPRFNETTTKSTINLWLRFSGTRYTSGASYAQTLCLLWTIHDWSRSLTTKHHSGLHQAGCSSKSPHPGFSNIWECWSSPLEFSCGVFSRIPFRKSKKAGYSELLFPSWIQTVRDLLSVTPSRVEVIL